MKLLLILILGLSFATGSVAKAADVFGGEITFDFSNKNPEKIDHYLYEADSLNYSQYSTRKIKLN